jgi:hypothetical protein
MVGKSYPPEFYSFIKNSRVRTVMEQIAEETEEDYQKLIKLLESFGVKIIRPDVSSDYTQCLGGDGKIIPPPMTPRDYSIMLGKDFYFLTNNLSKFISQKWDTWKGTDWPDKMPTSLEELQNFPDWIMKEISTMTNVPIDTWYMNEPTWDANLVPPTWEAAVGNIKNSYNIVPPEFDQNLLVKLNSAMITRIGKDLYVGTDYYNQDISFESTFLSQRYPEYRWHIVDTGGHSDATFCPVVPGLIVSLQDIPTYADTFPDWEVVYLPGQSWNKVTPFLNLKKKNKGKWWVPGQELNDEFTDFVESWLGHWVGYVEETVFDVNMLVIDEKNVVCNNYNEEVFKAFDRYGITPHVINFRHRYFWDGGLHCITSDIHREGTMKDYFPGRG